MLVTNMISKNVSFELFFPRVVNTNKLGERPTKTTLGFHVYSQRINVLLTKIENIQQKTGPVLNLSAMTNFRLF